ncbi:hypothetical protein QD172_01740 [Cobetia sp. 10Alg 146]|uniref:hypothetical protein n=1 Tax=Cobetia sp. 10Alg 146 TaxID=3040019 RepID=UPI002449E305|nr:hypothetical protein [Cobetia sp. 10Alg 146]MDH2289972.1 hypothetical protein [Cobetia sp. 10Alg 146]
MSDELKRIAAENTAQWVVPALIIFGAVLVKWLYSKTRRSWFDWLRYLTVSVFVGGVMNLYLADIPDQDMGPGAKGAILALVVLVADHILTGIFKVGAEFARDPHEFMVNWSTTLRDIWRGRK